MKTRTVRQTWKHRGKSVYAVERLDPPPTFTKGDGYDDGRNLLGALLIGPYWSQLGYIVGTRGKWTAYRGYLLSARGTTKKLGTAATVREAAELFS